MTISRANMGPRLTLEVTEKERETAKAAKKEFKNLLKQLDDSLRLIFDIKDAIVKERPTQDDLQNKYRGRLLRYRRKVQSTFNDQLLALKEAIENLSPISDSETSKLREIIVSEFDELSDSVESFLSLLGEAEKEGFTQKLERLCAQLEKRKQSINEVIDNQLFSHIDSDILGRKKVSSLKANIYKRIRLLRKIS